jgi:hypothetical protein
MRASKAVGARPYDALHRPPGMPAHAQAAERNANAAARRLHHRPFRHRALRTTPLRSLGSHHGRLPRLLAGWQAWLGRGLGQGQR